MKLNDIAYNECDSVCFWTYKRFFEMTKVLWQSSRGNHISYNEIKFKKGEKTMTTLEEELKEESIKKQIERNARVAKIKVVAAWVTLAVIATVVALGVTAIVVEATKKEDPAEVESIVEPILE